jgi:colanic acid biosynthesis glycosyl transferase WcaI
MAPGLGEPVRRRWNRRIAKEYVARAERSHIEVYNSLAGNSFFEGLIVAWQRSGRDVERCHVLTADAYRGNHGSLSRLWLRWRMYGGFAWTSWRRARRTATDIPVRVVTTNPFFAPAMIKRAAGQRGVTIGLLYDLYPDALIQSGLMSRNSWIARRIAAVTRAMLRDCETTVFLGEYLRRYAEEQYGPARRAAVIPVGADGAPFRTAPRATNSSFVTIMYAGQMGRMHEAHTLAETIATGVPDGLRLSFQATGSRYDSLRATCGGSPRCNWGGALMDAEWRQAMLEAEVGVVTIAPGADKIVMPSKTYGAMVAGQAILAVCPERSDLAALVRTHDCGWVIDPGDVQALRRCWHEIAADRVSLQRKRERAYAAGHSQYEVTVLAKRWEHLFEELLENRKDEGP